MSSNPLYDDLGYTGDPRPKKKPEPAVPAPARTDPMTGLTDLQLAARRAAKAVDDLATQIRLLDANLSKAGVLARSAPYCTPRILELSRYIIEMQKIADMHANYVRTPYVPVPPTLVKTDPVPDWK